MAEWTLSEAPGRTRSVGWRKGGLAGRGWNDSIPVTKEKDSRSQLNKMSKALPQIYPTVIPNIGDNKLTTFTASRSTIGGELPSRQTALLLSVGIPVCPRRRFPLERTALTKRNQGFCGGCRGHSGGGFDAVPFARRRDTSGVGRFLDGNGYSTVPGRVLGRRSCRRLEFGRRRILGRRRRVGGDR